MKFLIVILFVIASVKGDYNLNIKMEYFKNQASIQNERVKFKFCLGGLNNNECDSKLVTQVLGENAITEEQFKQTTEFLKFKILNNQINKRDFLLNLSITVVNSNDRPISVWNLYIAKNSSLIKLNEWIKFNQINFDLKQQLTFNYELKCSDDFKGLDCSIPICDLDCKNNGQCVRENGKQFCKCDSNLFKGDLCEIRIVHACDSCLNGGSCFGNGQCLCPPGYTGKFCQNKQTVSQCGSFSCENLGVCFIDNQNEYSCICQSGFVGKRCERDIRTSTTTVKPTTQTTSVESTTVENIVQESFSKQEILIILICGVGIPILFILVAIIFYRVVINKKGDQVVDEEHGKKMNKDQNKQVQNTKKENVYVVCPSSMKQLPSLEATKMSSDVEKMVNKYASKKSEFSETEVYSNCIYEDINKFTNISLNVPEKNLYSNNLVTYV